MEYKVAELEGALLDAAVAKAEGLPVHPGPGRYVVAAPVSTRWAHQFAFSTDWKDGGPIIERERITLAPVGRTYKAWYAEVGGAELDTGVEVGYGGHSGEAPNPLVAAMRAYVASRFGEKVELP